MVLQIPRILVRPQAQKWGLRYATTDGGPSMSLQDTSAETSGGGLWQVTLTAIELISPALRNMWDGFAALQDGGATPIVMPMFVGLRAPWPVVDGRPVVSSAIYPHSDGTYFSDGTGYAEDVIQSHLVGARPLRATSVTLHMDYGGEITMGMHFSIRHSKLGWRLYRVRRVIDAIVGDNAGSYVLDIRPPLRQAITGDEDVVWDTPRCVMRMTDAEQWHQEEEARKFPTPTITMIERLWSAK